MGTDCCGSCEGRAFCSPQSGSCYDTKAKDYYEKCFAHDDCCSSCGGLGFCSPLSGNCFSRKRKTIISRVQLYLTNLDRAIDATLDESAVKLGREGGAIFLTPCMLSARDHP